MDGEEDSSSSSKESAEANCIICSQSLPPVEDEIDTGKKSGDQAQVEDGETTKLDKFLQVIGENTLKPRMVAELAQLICAPCELTMTKISTSKEEVAKEEENVRRLQQQLIESFRKLEGSVGELRNDLEGMQGMFKPAEGENSLVVVTEIKDKIGNVARNLSVLQGNLSSQIKNSLIGFSQQKIAVLEDMLKVIPPGLSSNQNPPDNSNESSASSQACNRPSPKSSVYSEEDVMAFIDLIERTPQKRSTPVPDSSSAGQHVNLISGLKVPNPLRSVANSKKDSSVTGDDSKDNNSQKVTDVPVRGSRRQQLNYSPRISARNLAKRERTENLTPSPVRKKKIVRSPAKIQIPAKYYHDRKLRWNSAYVSLTRWTPEMLSTKTQSSSSHSQPASDLKTSEPGSHTDGTTTASPLKSESDKGVKTKVVYFGDTDEEDDDEDESDGLSSESSSESADSTRDFILGTRCISQWKRKVMLGLWGSYKYKNKKNIADGVPVKHQLSYNKLYDKLTYAKVAINFNERAERLECSKCKGAQAFQTSHNESLFFEEITGHILTHHLNDTGGSTVSSGRSTGKRARPGGDNKQWDPTWDEEENETDNSEEEAKEDGGTSRVKKVGRPRRSKKCPRRYVLEQKKTDNRQVTDELDLEDIEEKERSGAEEWMPDGDDVSEKQVKVVRRGRGVRSAKPGRGRSRGRPGRRGRGAASARSRRSPVVAPAPPDPGPAARSKDVQTPLFAKIKEWNESKEGQAALHQVKRSALDIAQTAVAICTFNKSSGEMWILGTPVTLHGSVAAPFLKCSQCIQSYTIFPHSEDSDDHKEAHREMILHVLSKHLKVFHCTICNHTFPTPLTYGRHMQTTHGKGTTTSKVVPAPRSPSRTGVREFAVSTQQENGCSGISAKNSPSKIKGAPPTAAGEEDSSSGKSPDPEWDFKRSQQKISLKGISGSQRASSSSESSNEGSELESI